MKHARVMPRIVAVAFGFFHVKPFFAPNDIISTPSARADSSSRRVKNYVCHRLRDRVNPPKKQSQVTKVKKRVKF